MATLLAFPLIHCLWHDSTTVQEQCHSITDSCFAIIQTRVLQSESSRGPMLFVHVNVS